MIVQQKRCWNLNIYLRILFYFIFNWSVYPLISSSKSGPWPELECILVCPDRLLFVLPEARAARHAKPVQNSICVQNFSILMRFRCFSTHWNTFYSLLLFSHLFRHDILCVLSVHSQDKKGTQKPFFGEK